MLLPGVLAACSGGCGQSRPLPNAGQLDKIHTMAILPFEDAPGKSGSGRIIVNAMMSVGYELPGISIVERGRLSALQSEHDLKLAGVINTSSAVKLGKLAGADAVILGELMQYDTQSRGDRFRGGIGPVRLRSRSASYKHLVSVSIRIVDVKHGRIIYAKSGQGSDTTGYAKAAELAVREVFKDLSDFYNRRR